MAPIDGRRISPLVNITPTSLPEPIAVAIVGMGCRFPGGVDSPATYWDFLTADGDALVDIPGDRGLVDKFYAPGASAPGLSRVRRCGFLTQPADQFNAAFFGIWPREADYIDPRQRLRGLHQRNQT